MTWRKSMNLSALSVTCVCHKCERSLFVTTFGADLRRYWPFVGLECHKKLLSITHMFSIPRLYIVSCYVIQCLGWWASSVYEFWYHIPRICWLPQASQAETLETGFYSDSKESLHTWCLLISSCQKCGEPTNWCHNYFGTTWSSSSSYALHILSNLLTSVSNQRWLVFYSSILYWITRR